MAMTSFESHEVTFTNTDTATQGFSNSYSSPPTVMISPYQSNINIFISSLTSTGVTIKSSTPFTGTVHLQVIG